MEEAAALACSDTPSLSQQPRSSWEASCPEYRGEAPPQRGPGPEMWRSGDTQYIRNGYYSGSRDVVQPVSQAYLAQQPDKASSPQIHRKLCTCMIVMAQTGYRLKQKEDLAPCLYGLPCLLQSVFSLMHR